MYDVDEVDVVVLMEVMVFGGEKGLFEYWWYGVVF